MESSLFLQSNAVHNFFKKTFSCLFIFNNHSIPEPREGSASFLHYYIDSKKKNPIQFFHLSCLKYILFLSISDVVIYVLGNQQSQLFVYVVAGYEEAFKSTKTFRLFKHSTTQEFFLVLLLLVISSFVDFVPCGVDFFVTVTRL